jgi:hypothetical protein
LNNNIVHMPMSKEEAAQITERIHQSVESVWDLITEAYERQAWKALGYESWKGYVTREFKMSERRSYQIIDRGKVIKALTEAASPTEQLFSPDISEGKARKIKPRLEEVTAAVEEKVAEGVEPHEAIREVVDKLDEPVLEPIVVNGKSYVTGEAVAAAVKKVKDNDSAGPLLSAITRIRIAQNNSSIAELVDDLGPTDAAHLISELTDCLPYLRDVLQKTIETYAFQEARHG